MSDWIVYVIDALAIAWGLGWVLNRLGFFGRRLRRRGGGGPAGGS